MALINPYTNDNKIPPCPLLFVELCLFSSSAALSARADPPHGASRYLRTQAPDGAKLVPEYQGWGLAEPVNPFPAMFVARQTRL